MSAVISRSFSMPSARTFSIPPISTFVRKYLANTTTSVDPFAKDSQLCTFTNDLNQDTAAQCHMDAEEFLSMLAANDVRADVGIFDPPYSPRQISECYRITGKPVGMAETQNAALYRRVRDLLDALIIPGGIVLSFGWNSMGMGLKRGYEILEIQLVAHGDAHNDTICMAERKRP